MRVYEADKGLAMTEEEAKSFLHEARANLLIATIDSRGDPNIHAVWYYFDKESVGLYFITARDSRKARNMKGRSIVYFSVDEDGFPGGVKGVRGKGRARVIKRGPQAISIAKKVLGRYVKLEHPLGTEMLDGVRDGSSMVMEIVPLYFTTWDYLKQPPDVLKRQREAEAS